MNSFVEPYSHLVLYGPDALFFLLSEAEGGESGEWTQVEEDRSRERPSSCLTRKSLIQLISLLPQLIRPGGLPARVLLLPPTVCRREV